MNPLKAEAIEAGLYIDDYKVSGGFSYPMGWESLVKRLVGLLKHMNTRGRAATFRITQVKTKFGFLRVYVDMTSNGTDPEGAANDMQYVQGYIAALESMSDTLCAQCGAHVPSDPDRGWNFPACSEHADAKPTHSEY